MEKMSGVFLPRSAWDKQFEQYHGTPSRGSDCCLHGSVVNCCLHGSVVNTIAEMYQYPRPNIHVMGSIFVTYGGTQSGHGRSSEDPCKLWFFRRAAIYQVGRGWARALNQMSKNFLFGPCNFPHLELHLAIYNQHTKKLSCIVKVQKYFMPRGFATCAHPHAVSKRHRRC